jgi:hypothetical protein
VVGVIALHDTRNVKIWTEVAAPAPATGAARK